MLGHTTTFCIYCSTAPPKFYHLRWSDNCKYTPLTCVSYVSSTFSSRLIPKSETLHIQTKCSVLPNPKLQQMTIIKAASKTLKNSIHNLTYFSPWQLTYYWSDIQLFVTQWMWPRSAKYFIPEATPRAIPNNFAVFKQLSFC